MSTNSFALVTYLPEHDGQRLTPKPCTARKRRPRSGAPLPILLPLPLRFLFPPPLALPAPCSQRTTSEGCILLSLSKSNIRSKGHGHK